MRALVLSCLFIFTISLLAQPQADFVADTTQGCSPLQVNFTNQSTAANQYQWKFGDGNGSSQTHPSHLYLNPGTYSVTLIATSSNGIDSLVRQSYIIVHKIPIINYSLSDTIQCLYGDSISFNNNGDTANTYTWSFGDGNGTQGYEPNYTYNDTGFFRTTLMAESPYGCQNTYSLNQRIHVKDNPDVDFLVDTSLVCQSGSPVNFASLASSSLTHYWDFGDGNNDSSSQNVQHIYQTEGTYDVSLTAEDVDGCRSTEEKKEAVRFYIPENLSTISLVDTACSNQAVQFGVDSNWAQVNWNFGDGNTSSESQLAHSYLKAGSYQASITVYDSVGCKQTRLLDSIHIAQSPIADFRDTTQNHCLPFSIHFENTSIFADSYNWQLGNQQSNQENPTFSLTQAGILDLELIAQNALCYDTLFEKNYLKIEDPYAEMQVDDSLGCAPHPVVFSLRNPSRFKSVRWFFGNRDSAINHRVIYTYEIGGLYKPYVITETKKGCLDTAFYSAKIEVQDAQSIFNQPDTIFLCRSGIVDFEGQSIGGGIWNWDFGDGDSSSIANPSHFYDSAGVYEVSLLTKNTLGCYYRVEPYNVVVVTDPQADFSMNRNNCPNFEMQFTSNAAGAVDYLWNFGDGVTDSVAHPIHYYSGSGFYNVSLRVEYPNGCFAQRTKINAVQMLPCIGNDSVVGGLTGGYAGAFNDTLDPIIACAPFQLELNIPDDSLRNIWWDFGDGNFSTSFNPIHVYTNRGNYSLQMIVEDNNGQFDTVINQNYILLTKPTADFQFNINNSCNSSIVNFQNQSTFASHYNWNLGSAGTSINVHPSAYYAQSTNELIRLKAIDTNACYDQVLKNISLGSPNPYFDFKSEVCLGDTVYFASNIKNYTHYEWQIGSNILSGDTVRYVAQDTGEFLVRIRVTDSNSCFKSFTSPKQLVVSDPQANYVFNDSASACDYYDLNISNLSSGAEEFIWILGNGDSLFEESPTYRYTDSGVFSLQLLALKDRCVDTSQTQLVTVNKAVADFELQQNSICLPIQVQFFDRSLAAVRWNWSFGDGDSSQLQNPQHTFTSKSEIQSLSIVDTNNCKASIQKNELHTHRAAPQADQWEGCVPLMVQFADSSLNVANYYWDFGDGDTSSQQFPVHTYTQPGTYDVSLITQSIEGCYDTIVIESAVVAGSVLADFSTTADTNSCAPHMVVFENHSQGAINYQWSFGDGAISTNENPIHVYHNAGQFNVQLIVDNGFSCIDTLLKMNRFNINTPEIAFSMTDSVFCGPHEVEFKDLSKRVASRRWFFGDGSTSTNETVKHTYNDVGTYTVSLVVTDTANCIENLSKDIRIKRKPLALFSLDSTYGCAPATISFRNHSSELEQATFTWMLNQQSYFAFDTSIIFTEQAAYDVSLMVENSNGCADTVVKENYLKIYEEEENSQPRVKRISRNEKGDWFIDWEKNDDFNFKYYQLYRKNSNGVFIPYVQLWDQNQSHYQIGYRSNWNSRQCFKIEVVKYCSEPQSIESIPSYCSIDLQVSKYEDVIRLNWSSYPIEERLRYELYRKSKGSNSYDLIAILDTSTFEFIDSTLLCPELYVYQIKLFATDDSYSVFSDTVEVTPKNLIEDFEIEMKRITILDDRQVLLEWEPLGKASEIAHHLYISKKNSRGRYSIVDELPLESSSFLDVDPQIPFQKMEYKISLANRCERRFDLEGDYASIWLELNQEGEQLMLKWTLVKGIRSGVDYYLIQKQNADGSWKTINKVAADKLKYELILK